MDPTATLTACHEAINDNDIEFAKACYQAYRRWRKMHGFEPLVLGCYEGDATGTLVRGDTLAQWCLVQIQKMEAK